MSFKKGQSGNPKGRPRGSNTRPQLKDFFTEEEVKELVYDLRQRAKTDNKLLKFLAEQIFGRAIQPNEHTGADGKDLPTPIINVLPHHSDPEDKIAN